MITLYGRTFRYALVACTLGMSLAACSTEKPQSTVTRGVDSGVTSSNGGGMAPTNYGRVSTQTTP